MNPSNNNEMQLFNYKEANVRTVMRDASGTGDWEPWFVAKDVAELLGYVNTNKAISAHCYGVPNCYPIVDNMGRNQEARIINESDLYRLIAHSKLPGAVQFERWIYEEVLPTIRKTGGAYLTATKAEELLANPDLIIGLAQQVKGLQEERKRLQEELDITVNVARELTTERDHAVRTKACISDSKTATAMQTASVLSRRVNNLEKKLGIAENHMQVRAIPWIKEFFGKKPSTGAWVVIGQRMKIIAVEMQEQVIKVSSEKFGEVNAYSVAVVERFKQLLMLDESYLSKWRA